MQKLKIIVGIVASPRMMSITTNGGKKSKAQPTVEKGIRHGLGTERNVGKVSGIRSMIKKNGKHYSGRQNLSLELSQITYLLVWIYAISKKHHIP
jgi:hypothetical protein